MKTYVDHLQHGLEHDQKSGRKMMMWESQQHEGRGGKEVWKPEFRPWGSSNIRHKEEDEARKE